MFEFLFKYAPVSYQEGEIALQYGRPALMLMLLGGLMAFLAVMYAFNARYPDRRTRAVSYTLRAGALFLLCLPLFEPVLVTPDVVPKQNFVAVLVDDSESMMLRDGTLGQTRRDEAHALVQRVLPALSRDFKVRLYTFSDVSHRVNTLSSAAAGGDVTDLSTALDRVLEDFQGLPLSGIVLLTDGADNSRNVPQNRAEVLRDRGIPLHVVGLGQERFYRDRELLEVVAGTGVEETTGADIDVKLRSWSGEPEAVTLHLYRGDERVRSIEKTLRGDGNIDQFTLFYEPSAAGVVEYRVEVASAEGETNTLNNRRNTLIDNGRDTIRVLYFEGHLRRDFKHVKRALEDDRVVTFTSVARTGIGKYYRQGIQEAQELAGGFPATETELFRYRAVVLGDVEAASFTPEQLAMLERFVRVRGGGLLMMGGLNAFAEGNFWNTPVADALPVEIDPGRRRPLPPDFSRPGLPPQAQGYRFTPTEAGLESPILKLALDPDSNRAYWAGMPGLTSINYLGAVKMGALVLAEKPEDDFGPAEPVLAVQRYGRGRSAALATASTWRWQMFAEASDLRHERFWRQLVRWLVASSPGAVNIDQSRTQFAAGDRMPLSVTVFDAQFNPHEAATVSGTLIDATGQEQAVVFLQNLTDPGRYDAEVDRPKPGLYRLHVSAAGGQAMIGEDDGHFLVRSDGREFYDATLKKRTLQDLARISGGRYYDPAGLAALPEALRHTPGSASIYQAASLGDMPALFLLAVFLLATEWIYRRRKGLP